ncbi:polyprenyl synthetase family protein [Streptomyces botrytidirepellens]|uniref:Uncharacterized protein n=1 Tax=Streptomyces botrytidirepellens TaxID=2486417 RepID=A0A3M8VUY2_9ACTN|nr:polyprenyl synthetase family protein [Streptomyces botrytidirepellens]RNG21652.1 hypothetical protein EEJ42_22435 [Streptomyces botrytidirepellens]
MTAGTLGYYTFDALMQRVPQAAPETMLRIYRLYLRDLRAGQALDIAGHHAAFDEAVASGDARPLLDEVRTAHRLKTGMLVRSTAEVSAILGGADEQQLDAICRYFEAVGTAYQITDDVADLYGLVTAQEHQQGITTRSPAEDLRNGEVTYPVAHAVGLLDATDRQHLRAALRQHSDTGARTASEFLVHSGALEACMTEARSLVEEAWDNPAPSCRPPRTRPWCAPWAGTPPNAKPTTSSAGQMRPRLPRGLGTATGAGSPGSGDVHHGGVADCHDRSPSSPIKTVTTMGPRPRAHQIAQPAVEARGSQT